MGRGRVKSEEGVIRGVQPPFQAQPGRNPILREKRGKRGKGAYLADAGLEEHDDRGLMALPNYCRYRAPGRPSDQGPRLGGLAA